MRAQFLLPIFLLAAAGIVQSQSRTGQANTGTTNVSADATSSAASPATPPKNSLVTGAPAVDKDKQRIVLQQQNDDEAQAPKGQTVDKSPKGNETIRSGGGSRTEQLVEHIYIRDKGSSVEEVRVGGETQSISVQPNNEKIPAYDVKPKSSANQSGTQTDRGEGGTTGNRLWKIKEF